MWRQVIENPKTAIIERPVLGDECCFSLQVRYVQKLWRCTLVHESCVWRLPFLILSHYRLPFRY